MVALRFMITPDRKQAREFTLRTGIGLQRHRIKTRDLRQHLLKLFEELLIALSLFQRCKGMQQREVPPGDGDHFAGGIQFHGAGSKRNHGLVQRQVLHLQLPHIAQHFSFGMIAREHRVGEIA